MTETVTTIAYFNTIICVAYCLYSFRKIKRNKHLNFFSISSAFIVITNGLAIPFVQFSNSDYKFIYEDEVIFKAFINMSIFISVCFILQFLMQLRPKKYTSSRIVDYYYYSNNRISKKFNKRHITIFFCIFLSLSIFGCFRFLFLSSGIDYLGTILNFAGDHSEYYVNRIKIGGDISKITGMATANISSSYLNPVLMLAIIYDNKWSQKKLIYNIRNSLILLYLILSTLILAFVFAKRASVLISILFPVYLIYIIFNKDKSELSPNVSRKKSKKLLAFVIFITSIFLVSGYVFAMISGTSLLESIWNFIERAIIIPCGTNNFYYSAFPDRINYTGIHNIFDLSPEISYQDIAYVNTGSKFTANAFLLAVAYSGAGYIGVFLVSLTYSLLCILNDYLLNRLSPDLKIPFIFMSSYSLYSLINVPLLNAFLYGGFLSSTIVIYLSLTHSQKKA